MNARFRIDSNGTIQSADGPGCARWGLSPDELAGRSFVDLFALEVRAQTDEERSLHWEILREAAEAEPLPINAQPDQGAAFPAEISVETGHEGFIANVRVPENGESDAAGGAVQVETEDRTAETSAPSPLPPPRGEQPADPPETEESPPETSGSRQAPPPAADPVPGESTREKPTGHPQPFGAPEAGTSQTADPPWEALGRYSPLGIFDLDLRHDRFYYSPSWKTMLGYTDSELPDRHETLIKLIHPEDSEAAPDRASHKHPGKSMPFSVEYRVRHKSGKYIWVQAAGTRQFGTNGEISRVTGIHLDIQERKEIEDETLRNEERFLALLYKGDLAFFDLDFRSSEAFFSPAWLHKLGYEEDEIPSLPESFRRLLDPSTFSEEYFTLFHDEDQGRPVFTREFRFQCKDGSFLNLPLRIIRLSNRRGELLRVIGLESHPPDPLPPDPRHPSPDMLLQGLNSAHEGLILTDAESRVVFCNAKAETLTSTNTEGIRGRTLSEALPLLEKTSGRSVQNLSDEVLASGEPIALSRDFLLQTANGDEREIVFSCNPVRDANGKILGTVAVFRDPAEMSLTPEELVRSNRLEALGLLAGGIAHDFNNLLTSILGGVSLARETHEWEPLERSEKGCVAAKNLTRQLLGFARGREMARKAMRINGLVRDCLRMATAGSRVKADAELPDDLYPSVIDSSQIGQVFQNLFVNAVQAMADTENATLTVSGENISLPPGTIAELNEGDYLRINITDTGPGIPPDRLEKIFEPFFTTRKSGTGLGLSTVHSIVRKHGGQITVTSRVGEGTTFTLYLPKSDEAQERDTRRAPELKHGSGRILFMDDDEEITTIASGMLASLDYECDTARNGEEALALYRRYLNVQRPYDAVILDLTIVGGMGGEETLRKLLEMDPDVRAIVSSGYNSEETNEYYLGRGFYGVLSKPYRSAELGKILRQVLGKDQARPGEKEPPKAE